MNDHGVKIKEAYRDYTPPINPVKVVDRLLAYVDGKYLSGLKTVVLTNTENLSSTRKRGKTWSRKKKVRLKDSCGLYHQSWENKLAWIEVFVDNVFKGWPLLMLRIPLFRDMALADVLYHELGHHIHKAHAPEFKEREEVAEQWRKRLSLSYFRCHHWYLWLIVIPLWPVVRLCRYIKKWKS